MYRLPTELEINGKYYKIRKRGDYRLVLDVFSILEDYSITQSERIISALIMFYEDFNVMEDVLMAKDDLDEAISKMFQFFNADRPEGKANDRKLIDWEQDSAIISSAINTVAGKEIRELEYLHWWTFIAYYMAIGESTLSTVVSLRDKILRGKKLEKWEKEFKRDNPQYFIWNHQTVEEQEANEWLKSVWNKE